MENNANKEESLSSLDTIVSVLSEIGEFYYWPNDGNLGDYLIAEATRQLFRRNNIVWKEYHAECPPEEEDYAIVYGGGGRFVPHWGGMELFQERLICPQVRRCVILPHSIHGVDAFVSALDERHTVFCREFQTLRYCRSLNTRAEFCLAHDMGVGLSVVDLPELSSIALPCGDADTEAQAQYDLLAGSEVVYARHCMDVATVKSAATGRKVAFVLRTDREKSVHVESSRAYDLSILYSASCRETPYSGQLVRLMADLLSVPDVVVTDRLHVAIMAMHVGKDVYMLDNDYGKLSGVYEVSLKDRSNVHMLPAGEPWPVDLQSAWQMLNAPRAGQSCQMAKMAGGVLISVIVPVYNTAPWLRRCLDSICTQTYQNLEILCVNDGSTDNSADILAEYAAKDNRIKVFTQANAGLSAARNTALKHAAGEWVTGVDSDDYLELGVYEQAVACVSEEVDMVCFGVLEVDETGAPMPYNAYFALPAAGQYEMTPDLAETLNVCFWSKLWRRRLLEDNGLCFPRGLVHEDEALYYLAAPYVNKVASCPQIGYYYVQRQGSIMNSGAMSDLARVARYVPVLEYVSREYGKRHMLRTSARAYLVKMFQRLCTWLYWSEEKEAIVAVLSPIIRSTGVFRDNYLLERLLPSHRWQRLFLSRYDLSKVYRVFGVACWAVEYSENGMPLAHSCPLWGRIKKLLMLK